jgi:hypothetical protein
VYEIFPIATGMLLGVAVRGRGRPRLFSRRGVGGLALAALIGVGVSVAGGEWREGVVFPIWDAFQAACAYLLILAVAWRRLARRVRE